MANVPDWLPLVTPDVLLLASAAAIPAPGVLPPPPRPVCFYHAEATEPGIGGLEVKALGSTGSRRLPITGINASSASCLAVCQPFIQKASNKQQQENAAAVGSGPHGKQYRGIGAHVADERGTALMVGEKTLSPSQLPVV